MPVRRCAVTVNFRNMPTTRGMDKQVMEFPYNGILLPIKNKQMSIYTDDNGDNAKNVLNKRSHMVHTVGSHP